MEPIQPTKPELFHSWEQFAGFDVKEAKDKKRLLGVVRDLLIMKMEIVEWSALLNRCFNCLSGVATSSDRKESLATKLYSCIRKCTRFLLNECVCSLSIMAPLAHWRRWTHSSLAMATAIVFCPSILSAQYSTPNLSNSAYTTSAFAASVLDLVGQCTWYVYGRIQETGVASQQILNLVNPNTGKTIFLGNASSWEADAVAVGLSIGTQPQPGALAVWTSYNHVAFVETSSGQVTESNNKPKPGYDVLIGGAYAHLRSSWDSSSNANILWEMPQFTVMNVLSGPVSENGYQWFQLTGNGYTGWVAWLKADLSGPAVQAGSDNLWWNITRIKLQPESPLISGTSPIYIYLGGASTTDAAGGSVITIDGVHILSILNPEMKSDPTTYLLKAIDPDGNNPYWTNLINEKVGAINAFSWSNNIYDTEETVNDLSIILEAMSKASRKTNSPFVVLAHSWGTVLAYLAMSRNDNVIVDKLITLGSPLAAQDETVVSFTRDMLVDSGIDGVSSLSNVRAWHNYWAACDPISGSISSSNNYQVDPNKYDDFGIGTTCHAGYYDDYSVWQEILFDVYLTRNAAMPPTISTSLSISPPSSSYSVGQTISGRFVITNKGATPITVAKLTIGGRDPEGQVADFPAQTCVIVEPNVGHKYVGSLTLSKTGVYEIFPAYETLRYQSACPAPDGNWNTAISVEAGVIQYTLDNPLKITAANDNTQPTIKLTAPSHGEPVDGTYLVTADASDYNGVGKVEFYLDNVLQFTDSRSPYSWTWDTTNYTNTSYSLVVKAYDLAGNEEVSPPITVTVNNASGTGNNLPDIPTALTQHKSDGSTGLSLGGTAAERTVVMKGGVTDLDNDAVSLEVELQPLGSSFTDSPSSHCTSGDAVPSGGVASVMCFGIADGQYRWQARGKDNNKAAGNWLSAGGNPENAPDFIVAATTTEPTNFPPIVSVLSPNGGETVQASSPYQIKWMATDGTGTIQNINIYNSLDGGLNWELPPVNVANTGVFEWTPSTPTIKARIKVMAEDSYGAIGWDISDGNFIVVNSCPTPTAPLLESIAAIGDSYTISWTASGNPTSFILEEDTSSHFTSPTSVYSNNSFKWYSGRKVPGTFYYRVTALNDCGESVWSATRNVTIEGRVWPEGLSEISPADGSTNVPLYVTLSWNSSHPTGESMTYDVWFSIGDSLFHNPELVSSNQAGRSFTVSNLPYDTTCYWKVETKDQTGDRRIGDVYQFTTTGLNDSNPPTGSVSINGDAAKTTALSVTLNLAVTDAETGVAFMQGSNDGTIWSAWKTYETKWPGWNLADLRYGGTYRQIGTYTVHVQFKDYAGNISSVYSDTIDKDAGTPGDIILRGKTYPTIQDAIDAAQYGDTVYLTEGIYTYQGTQKPPRYPSRLVGVVMKPGVNLLGAGADKTKLVAEDSYHAIVDADECLIQGLTIINASTVANAGRQSVYLESKNSKIRNCIITASGSHNTGILIYSGENNEISENIVINNKIGIDVAKATDTKIYNNTIASNSYKGIQNNTANFAVNSTIKNNIIVENSDTGISTRGAIVEHNNVWGNGYSDYYYQEPDQTGTNNNISIDPLFVTPASGDYSLSSSSPCRNAGTNVGIPYNEGAPDMGAFEYDATGIIRVSTNRNDAQFEIIGPAGVYQGSGTSWSRSDLPLGIYSVSYSPIQDLYMPPYEANILESNQTVTFQGAFSPDTDPPEGVPIGFLSPVYINFGEYATAGTLVDIVLSFTDAVAGLGSGAEMKFSNDGTNWSPPEPYSTIKKDWDLTKFGGDSASGIKTVYVNVSDAFNNWSDAFTDTILFQPDRKILKVPEDYDTIPNALSAADDGDIVHVLPGQYTAGSGIIIPQGVRLQGSGPSVTRIIASTFRMNSNTMIDGFHFNTWVNVGCIDAFKGIIISNNIFSVGGSPINIAKGCQAIVRNNLIHGFMFNGIRMADPQTSAIIENNTIVDNKIGVEIDNAESDTQIYIHNNIIANNQSYGIIDDNTSDTQHKHIYSMYDSFWNNTQGDFGGENSDKIKGIGYLNADPMFVDEAGSDYRLSSGSPCINSGYPDDRYNDLDGTRNDRGAYGGLSLNTPPIADFTSNYSKGSTSTIFTLDASPSKDGETSNQELHVRWDFDNDGGYDTFFSTNKVLYRYYDAPGVYDITLQVKDEEGFTSNETESIEVINQFPSVPQKPSPEAISSIHPINLTLSWSGGDLDPLDTVYYDIYFGTSSNPPLVSSGQTETTYSLGALKYFTRYNWKIVAIDNHGASSIGPVWSFHTVVEPIPVVPASLNAQSLSPGQIDLSWDDNSTNELGFEVERKVGIGGTYGQIYVLSTNTATFTDTGLQPNKTYYYRIRSFNSSGNSDYSNENSATTYPAKPTLTIHSGNPINDDTPTLDWSDVDGTSSYTLQYADNPDFANSIEIQNINSSTHTISITLSEGTWYWRIKAQNIIGNESDWSDSDSFKVDTVSPITTASLPGGTYASAQTIGLSATDNGSGVSDIYYTTDGATPTESSNVFSDPIVISSNTVLEFFAKDQAGNSEIIQTEGYLFIPFFVGLAYGPFRDGQDPNAGIYPNIQEMTEDVEQMSFWTGVVRTYSVMNNFDQIVSSAADAGINIMPGAAIGYGDPAYDQNQIDSLISVANNHSNVIGVIVGNEVLTTHLQLDKNELIDYLITVKESVNIPATTCEGPAIWQDQESNDLVDAVDFICVNIHPWWAGVSIQDAASNLYQTYNSIKELYPDKLIIIGETGWPTEGSTNGNAAPSILNQKDVLEAITNQACINHISTFLFEMYDEAWKTAEGTQGPHWGIHYTDRTKKHESIQLACSDTATPSDSIAPTTDISPPGGTYNASQTVTLSCSDASGASCYATYYTTDGSDPGLNSLKYSDSLIIDETTTLKYFSIDKVRNFENVISVQFIIENAAPIIDQGESITKEMDEDGSPTGWSAPDITATDADGYILTWRLASGPANGAAEVNGTGNSLTTFTYTPSEDWNGNDSLEIQVSDGEGGTDTITVSVTVHPVNDAPVIGSKAVESIDEDAPYTYSFSASDVDVGDTIALSAPSLPDWLSFDPQTGVLSGTPTNGEVGDHLVVLRASDGTVNVDEEFTITVTNTNDAPRFISDSIDPATEDTVYTYSITATDMDAGDALAITGTYPSWLTLTDNGDGTAALTGTPDNDAVGDHEVVLTVSDAANATDTQSFTLEVANINDAPVIGSKAVESIDEDSPYTYTFSASDVDVGNTITLSAPSLPDWLNFDPETGILSGTPTNGEVGDHLVVLRASDGTVNVDEEFTITVTNTNDAPRFISDSIDPATEDTVYTYSITATDMDAGDALAITGTYPSWLTLTDNGDGTAVLTGTPDNDAVGDHDVALTVTDAADATDTQSFTLEVANSNDAPVIGSRAVESIDEDAPYTYSFIASDMDIGDIIALSAPSLPDWLNFDPETGILSGTPTNGEVGDHLVVLRASDGTVNADQGFTITVTNTNDAPIIDGNPATSVEEDTAYSFTPTASDVDEGDSLTFSITNMPVWAEFDLNTGALTGIPKHEDVKITTGIIISVADKSGFIAELPAFSLSVEDITPPTATFTYSTTDPTDQDVVAILVPNEAVTVTNNKRLTTKTFTENGEFTFEFVDAAGNTGSATAVVNNIDKIAPVAELINTPDGIVASNTAEITVGGSEVTHYRYRLDESGYGLEYDRSQEIYLQDLSEGQHTLYVICCDEAGNWQKEDNATIAKWEVNSLLPGDVNGDGNLTLADAILSLRVACGLATNANNVIIGADVNGDNRIGLAEMLYVLQIMAGYR